MSPAGAGIGAHRRMIALVLSCFVSCWPSAHLAIGQSSPEGPVVDDDTYRQLSGVWNSFSDRGGFREKFSWGEAAIPDGAVAIDLRGRPPVIVATNTGRLRVLSVERRSETVFALEVEDEHSGAPFRGRLRLELVNSMHMVLYEEVMAPFRFFAWTGPEFVLRRIAGP
jgi:hypothetical protein